MVQPARHCMRRVGHSRERRSTDQTSNTLLTPPPPHLFRPKADQLIGRRVPVQLQCPFSSEKSCRMSVQLAPRRCDRNAFTTYAQLVQVADFRGLAPHLACGTERPAVRAPRGGVSNGASSPVDAKDHHRNSPPLGKSVLVERPRVRSWG